MCLSTYFATKDSITPNSANKQIPIKICHGTNDPMVPVQQGKLASQRLTEMGYAVDYSEYPMDHAVCLEEIAEISRWLQLVLG